MNFNLSGELRQARKDRQLVSKRLLLNEDDEVDSGMDIQSSDQVWLWLAFFTDAIYIRNII